MRHDRGAGADIVGDDAGQTLECCCLDTGHMGGGEHMGQWRQHTCCDQDVLMVRGATTTLQDVTDGNLLGGRAAVSVQETDKVLDCGLIIEAHLTLTGDHWLLLMVRDQGQGGQEHRLQTTQTC